MLFILCFVMTDLICYVIHSLSMYIIERTYNFIVIVLVFWLNKLDSDIEVGNRANLASVNSIVSYILALYI